MEVVIRADEAEVGHLGGEVIAQVLRGKPDAVIGVATGSSPISVYDDLGARVRAGEISLARATAFALDEYVGLPKDHPEAYRNVLARDFGAKVDIDPAKIFAPDGTAADIPAACADYERRMAQAGGVDVQILGIGTDGHVGFNEPGSSLASRTRIKTLTRQTRRDNARFFGGDESAVPTHCLTQGIGTIMAARHLLLIATGANKAEAIHHLVEGAVTAKWPGSILQLHPHVTVVLDEAAAGRLQLAPYFRETYDSKPEWQAF